MNIITKYAKPSRFSEAKYGTIYKVPISKNIENKEYTYYIQVNEKELEPRWLTVGDFFEEIFIEHWRDKHCLELCLGLFLNRKENK